jgi:phosphocarrier protein
MLEALDVPPDMPIEEIEAKARDLLGRVRNPEALIFTDVFGATPVQRRAAAGEQRRRRAGEGHCRGERADAMALAVLRRTSRSTCWWPVQWPARRRGSCRSPPRARRIRPTSPVPMIRTTITISNKLGLHARASAKLTKLATGYKSDVFMSRSGRKVNAKSIMGVMMLAAGLGAEIEIETVGRGRASRDGQPRYPHQRQVR